MATNAPTRAPGIRLVGRAPQPRLVLPRMDVCGLVGFARPLPGTPVHTPVVVDRVEAFAARFAEADLGVDAAGRPVRGRLGGAVRAFFANGGRRAVVVAVPPPDDGGIGPETLLDPRLAAMSVHGLARAAKALASAGDPPRGLQALMRVPEVTLVAVPDAGLVPAAPPAVTATVHVPDPPPAADPAFAPCADIPATRLTSLTPLEGGHLRVRWEATGAPGDDYEVETRRPGHAAVRVRSGDGVQRVPWAPGDVLTVRVRVRRGRRVGEWSPAGHIGAVAAASAPPEDLVAARAVQRALVRMCAARGDMLAVLAAPPGLDLAGVDAHRAALVGPPGEGGDHAGRVPPLDRGEEWAWSHALLAAPGLLLAAGEDPAGAPVPPDGALCGVFARVARTDGCWASPAGIPLTGVVALATRVPPFTPVTPAGHRPPRETAAEAAGVCLVRRATHGHLLASDHTLSADPDLRPVGVRRLLHLVRRAAVLHGTRWVFEPNGPALERAVQRGFEELLGLMYDRGAFRGANAREAFRVDVTTTAADRDAGRMIVRIRVVPAHPVRYLDIRLAVSADAVALVGEGV